MSMIQYCRPHWNTLRLSKEQFASTLAQQQCVSDLLEEILKVLTPAQLEQIANRFGYEAVV
jgi:hypothetical protein